MSYLLKTARSRVSLIIMSAVMLMVIGGALTAETAMAAGAGKTAILVFSDRGDPATMNEKQFQMRNQVGEYMEKDLIKRLNRAGFDAQLIRKTEEFAPASGKYLLKVAIVSYNPGSKAARMMVGYGAGATALDTRFELLGQGGKPIIADEVGVGSSRDWQLCARKVNEKTVAAVLSKLKQQ